MAKGGNGNIRAKIAKNAAIERRGEKQSGMFVSIFEQGHELFKRGVPLNTLWELPKQQGWKKARDAELRFYMQLLDAGKSPAGSIARLARVGIDVQAMQSAA